MIDMYKFLCSKNKRNKFLLMLLMFMIFTDGNAKTIVSVKDFGICANDLSDATLKFNSVIQYCRGLKDSVEIIFPEGRYDFYPNEKNRDDFFPFAETEKKPIGMYLRGLKNVTINGNGSRFIFHGIMTGVGVAECENIKLLDFSIDWERPLTSQATVVSITDNSIDLEIDSKAYPFTIKDDKLLFVGENWESAVKRYNIYDKTTREIITLTRDNPMGMIFERKAKKINNDLVRLEGPFDFKPEPGTIVSMYSQREVPGIGLFRNKNVIIEGVSVYYATDAGIRAFMCEDLTLLNTSVEINKTKNRVFSSMADASYFTNCKGLVTLNNCHHSGHADDWANFRGTYGVIDSVPTDSSLLVSHNKKSIYGYYGVGDSILFVYKKSMSQLKEKYSIKQIKYKGEKAVLTLNKQIPAFINNDYVVENITWMPEVHVVNCSVSRTSRARGILFTSSLNGLIENNVFRSAGSAILIEGDTNEWYEAGAVNDLTIRNNIFDNCSSSSQNGGWGRAVITITPMHYPTNSRDSKPFHKNIIIENNRFIHYDYNLLYARSVDGLSFVNNSVEFSRAFPMRNNKVNFNFDGCRNVIIKNNTFDEKYPPVTIEFKNMLKNDLKNDLDVEADVKENITQVTH